MKIRQQASVLQTPKILIVKILVTRRDIIKHERESILFCFQESILFCFQESILFCFQARDSTVSMYRVEIPVAIVIKQQMFWNCWVR